MNPKGAAEYAGPTGVVEGVVTVVGDPPQQRAFDALPAGCEHARALYAPAYRAGPKRELADALVAVIRVQGFVRPATEDRPITIAHCAVEPRSVDLSFGQRLTVTNEDATPYMPETPVTKYIRQVAVAGQGAVPLTFDRPGAYALTWLANATPGARVPTAIVWVVPSALHMVTKDDGKFRIGRVPAGKAYVAGSHLGMAEVGKEIEVPPGGTVYAELTLTYRAPPTARPERPAAATHRSAVQ